jgi:hypothetical protein
MRTPSNLTSDTKGLPFILLKASSRVLARLHRCGKMDRSGSRSCSNQEAEITATAPSFACQVLIHTVLMVGVCFDLCNESAVSSAQ